MKTIDTAERITLKIIGKKAKCRFENFVLFFGKMSHKTFVALQENFMLFSEGQKLPFQKCE